MKRFTKYGTAKIAEGSLHLTRRIRNELQIITFKSKSDGGLSEVLLALKK
jgi:hypothetical protein